jgi:hypothetical protein
LYFVQFIRLVFLGHRQAKVVGVVCAFFVRRFPATVWALPCGNAFQILLDRTIRFVAVSRTTGRLWLSKEGRGKSIHGVVNSKPNGNRR